MKFRISLALIVFCLVSCANMNKSLNVIKNHNLNPLKYQSVYIDVENDKYRETMDRKRGPETTFVSSEIRQFFKDIGINPYSRENESDLKIKCVFRHGWGIPILTVHFVLKLKYFQ